MATDTKNKKSKLPPGQKTRMQLQPHQVLVRPLVTEKGMHRSTRLNQYSFEISPLANKADVKSAVEELFDVKVLKVRTQNRKGKPRRFKFRYGYTKDWKKAVVTLDPEHRIDFF
ncbi:MAG: 50S ribosomal protein L23 [Planctomycetota bacterium]